MLIHGPPPIGAGENLWEGLIKDIGVSNYSAELIDKLIWVSDEVPIGNLNESYSSLGFLPY